LFTAEIAETAEDFIVYPFSPSRTAHADCDTYDYAGLTGTQFDSAVADNPFSLSAFLANSAVNLSH
jgi:hypothetical protein